MLLQTQNRNTGIFFIQLGLSCLFLSLLFGLIGSLQYVFPNFLVKDLTFQKTRPLHVYLAINWIVCTAVGLVYYFMQEIKGKLFSPQISFIHFALQSFIILVAVIGFFLGYFNGREYLEFPVWLNTFILTGWVLFGINFLKTITPNFKEAPIYIWQWATGILFFLITLSEAQLWLLPYFNNNIVRDVTVQWKALGSMVGAWNMLVYGTSMYLLVQTSGNTKIAYTKEAYFFYFLGMTNLMFNWGHHTYIVPASGVVKNISYIISMTELLILAHIICTWKKEKVNKAQQYYLTIKTIYIADVWVLLNLILALAISVPAINYYTHGTHITVAHAMGATIGINTFFLFAAIFYLLEASKNLSQKISVLSKAISVSHITLFIFWITLIAMGFTKMFSTINNDFFATTMNKLQVYFKIFSALGFVLFLSIGFIAFVLFNGIKKPSVETEGHS